MQITDVHAGGVDYSVITGHGLLDRCGEYIHEYLRGAPEPDALAVVSDSNVAPLLLERVCASLSAAGFEVHTHVIPAGEGSKNMNTLAELLEAFAGFGLTRRGAAVALGGGVVGDLVGFAAGCYMRGIRCIQLPTSLLAMSDSSVGGKTAVDLTAGKNLAGLFWQPSLVLCDIDTLSTLPDHYRADGMAEVIKTAVLVGGSLRELLRGEPGASELEEIVTECVRYKAAVVAADERESGPRRMLNLGHTAGHAVEKCSGYGIPHGHAVAAGLAIIARASAARGWCAAETADEITNLLERFGLPTGCAFGADELAAAALSDKKRDGGAVRVLIPTAFGGCTEREIPVGELSALFADGLR